MKMSQLMVVASLVVASIGFAKGGDGGGNDLLTRGSAAWFVAETAEHEVRGLVATNVITQAGLTRAEVALVSPSQSSIDLKTNIGPVNDTCVMYDHSSKHGTVIKKEVRCAKIAYYAEKFDLTRGSDAWAVIEAIEHSLRLAVVTDASVLASARTAESILESDSSVTVTLGFANGGKSTYRCLRQYYGQPDPSSLNCALQQ